MDLVSGKVLVVKKSELLLCPSKCKSRAEAPGFIFQVVHGNIRIVQFPPRCLVFPKGLFSPLS